MNVRELSKGDALQEIMWFVERHFRTREVAGYKVALLEVIHNGYKPVFERIIGFMKSVEKDKFLNWILITSIDPTDWDLKKRLVIEIQERFGHLFPPDMQNMSVGHLINILEEVISLVV